MPQFLLDTHTFLLDPDGLSKKTANLIEEPENEIFVSIVSIWEISLKYSIGKLKWKGGSPEDLLCAMFDVDFKILETDGQTIATFYQLPTGSHKDPFDRLLCWQAIRHELILISKDKALLDYEQQGLKMIW